MRDMLQTAFDKTRNQDLPDIQCKVNRMESYGLILHFTPDHSGVYFVHSHEVQLTRMRRIEAGKINQGHNYSIIVASFEF